MPFLVLHTVRVESLSKLSIPKPDVSHLIHVGADPCTRRPVIGCGVGNVLCTPRNRCSSAPSSGLHIKSRSSSGRASTRPSRMCIGGMISGGGWMAPAGTAASVDCFKNGSGGGIVRGMCIADSGIASSVTSIGVLAAGASASADAAASMALSDRPEPADAAPWASSRGVLGASVGLRACAGPSDAGAAAPAAAHVDAPP